MSAGEKHARGTDFRPVLVADRAERAALAPVAALIAATAPATSAVAVVARSRAAAPAAAPRAGSCQVAEVAHLANCALQPALVLLRLQLEALSAWRQLKGLQLEVRLLGCHALAGRGQVHAQRAHVQLIQGSERGVLRVPSEVDQLKFILKP